MTLVLLAVLGAVFLKGFREAIGLAVLIVALYLGLNVVVLAVALYELAAAPRAARRPGRRALSRSTGARWRCWRVAAHAVPEAGARAVGLRDRRGGDAAGQGRPDDTAEAPRGPHPQHAQAAASRAALIMSVFLLGSSLVTTLLIPAAAFAEGGEANGRALAYLAHAYLGDGFGTRLRREHDR